MYKDSIVRLVLDMEAFMTKKGGNIEVKNRLIRSIDTFTRFTGLKSIYINEVDNYLLPDVFIMPIFNKSIPEYRINADEKVYGGYYSIEIHERCFAKYTAEELTALVIHDILQNILSNTAKTRMTMAYTAAIDKYSDESIMSAFERVSIAEIMYLIHMDICMRPFHIPITPNSTVASDEVLRNYGIVDAYESAILKGQSMSLDNVDGMIKKQVDKDIKNAETIVKACVQGDITYYYELFRINAPMVTVHNATDALKTIASLGFTAKKPMNESIFQPTNETELQFQIDKVVTAMRFADSEDERAVLLYKLKNLRLKLISLRNDLQKKYNKTPSDKNIKYKLDYINNYLEEVDRIRDELVKMEIKPKRYGIFIKYPEGYDY